MLRIHRTLLLTLIGVISASVLIVADEDADNWLSWDDEVEVVKVKQWTREGICDHDTVTSLLLTLLLDAQKKMKKSNPKTGLPPLDPINITRHEFVANDSKQYSISGILTDVLVEGLSEFQILNIESDLDQMEANISLQLDTLRILGDYKMRGKIGYIVPVFGTGKFLLHPKQLQVGIFTKLGFKGGHLELQEFDFSVHLEDIFVKFGGLLGAGRRMSRALNIILNSFGIKVLRKLEPKIHERVQRRGTDAINKILQELKYDEAVVMGMLQVPLRCMFG